MKLIRTICICSAVLPPSHYAQADDITRCSPPDGVKSVSIPDGVPEQLQAKLGLIASPGAAFDSTDIVSTGISRRYIFVWQRGDHWIVATEHGGRGYNDPIMAYGLSPEGKVTLVQRNFPHRNWCVPTLLPWLMNETFAFQEATGEP